ncbi:MAG: hypothetical protein HZA88_23540 [Verrucomicrobia bacterium]|nr:hypothetical protein [Verrucomicrobiota bacterium]
MSEELLLFLEICSTLVVALLFSFRYEVVRKTEMKDKGRHHMITAAGLIFGLGLFWAMRSGLFGDRLTRVSMLYLALMIFILGGRAVLTELGIRKRCRRT